MAVPDIIASQQAYATSWVDQANAFINTVAQLANTQFAVTVPSLGYGRTALTDSARAEFAAQRPARPSVGTISAAVPDAPSIAFDEVIPIEVLDFVKTAPTLNFPATPSNVLPSVPSAPAIREPVVPDAPVVTLPTAPTVSIPALPEPPSVEMPYFSSVAPVDDLVVPTNTFAFYEQLYTSALLDEVKAKLLDNLQNGGYGIETADEAALWERARAREYATAQQTMDDAIRFHAARGFPLPTGELTVVLERAQQELQDKVSSANRDIALKRSELYVQNRQFTIQQAKELENILIGYQNSVMERALNAQRVTMEVAIQVYNALVARYNARLDAYKTEAQVFVERIRAALTRVEIYRAQIDGARLNVEAQRAAVEAYNAQLQGINSIVGIYRTRMEAAQIAANVERLRLDAYRGQVDAFAQQVQAKVAEFNMFRAQIEGEAAKTAAFEAEVRAYTAQVAGAKAKADVQVANANLQVEEARVLLASYQASIERFRAQLLSQTETIKSTTDIYRADISSFATAVDALKAAYQLEIEELGANLNWNAKAAEVNVSSARLQLEALVQAAAVRRGASEFGAKFYGDAVQATLSSITTLAAEVQNS